MQNDQIGEKQKKYIARWLWTGVGLIFVMLVIGGITRLTGSGLSMTDWNLIMGALPPMSAEEWRQVFERYKQFPEYQHINTGMTLWEFKQIFFWEYLHRLLGRLLGIVFLIPFAWLWIRGYFNKKLLKRMFVLMGLGAAQGAMGWIMVKSGLVDVPYVSHYRLAAHLLLAFILIAFCAWYALDLQQSSNPSTHFGPSYKPWGLAVGILLFLQIFWGALTAGLDAGFIYNTFPLMNESWLPQNGFSMQPLLINLVENPGTVQWVHRLLGTVLALTVLGLWVKAITDNSLTQDIKLRVHILGAIILVQYMLGIFTLIYYVPVALGVIHQAVAMILWVAWLAYYHYLSTISRQNTVAA